MKHRLWFVLGMVFFGLFVGALPEPTNAAQLYLSPENGAFQPGETVAVDLRIDSQNECVNAADIVIGYPKETVEAVDVSRGQSIFSLWINPPIIKKDLGLISLVGGVPGGYCGRSPGDPAVTNVVIRTIFRFKDGLAPLPQSVKISILPSSRIVLNDGLGTLAKLTVKDAVFSVANTGKPQRNEWTEALNNDKTPPEAFSPEIAQDKAVFEGKYFLVFSTQDKQTGIDRYEVIETKAKAPDKKASWVRADSPYLLTDQRLASNVFVRAFDKAGNERMAEAAKPIAPKKGFIDNMNPWLVAGLAITFLALFRIIRLILPL